jgi:3-hydroxybutyryl-CoA dehydratase
VTTVARAIATRERAVTERDILAFAGLTGDTHPQHTDPVWAAGSRFGEQIAHGLLVLSFAVGLLELDPDRVVALRSVRDAVFKRPVKIGDVIRVDGETIATQRVDGEHELVDVRLRVVNQDDQLVLRVRLELLCRA